MKIDKIFSIIPLKIRGGFHFKYIVNNSVCAMDLFNQNSKNRLKLSNVYV